ncbi:MAG: hypothetical protein IT428_29000 [Planctomycetaceae bacterium]|nr:hypothetical protein [Planctomycetaceae bacterium]
MDPQSLDAMRSHYRKIRRAVYEEATRPATGSSAQHHKNQELFKKHVIQFCNLADLSKYKGGDETTALELWRHLWTKIRYAGIRSSTATKEIEDIKFHFADFRNFASSAWELKSSGYSIHSAGENVRHFVNRTGLFENCQTVGNIPKLQKTIDIARKYTTFVQTKGDSTPCLNFITGGRSPQSPWPIHEHLLSIGYTGALTALHLMMELGFQVMKPDIVISSLFLEWGWLHKIIPDLPKDLKVEDLHGKGRHGSKWCYTKPCLYKPSIELARRISAAVKPEDLRNDIGWVTQNPLREFDVFVVKYGQMPEPQLGIVTQLSKSQKSCNIDSGDLI